jgi:hypothetical protein
VRFIPIGIAKMSQPPQYYHPPQEQSGAGRGAATRAATKATAYGGSEAGALIGQAVGPPIIGGVIGNIVGERFGEKAARKVGLDGAAGRISDDLASVVGQKNVDKMGEITLTALGYSNEEECVCCPCIPASQSLLIIMILFVVCRLLLHAFVLSCILLQALRVQLLPYRGWH